MRIGSTAYFHASVLQTLVEQARYTAVLMYTLLPPCGSREGMTYCCGGGAEMYSVFAKRIWQAPNVVETALCLNRNMSKPECRQTLGFFGLSCGGLPNVQVGYLAGAHGSALVEAGAGQALAAVTVGNRFEMQEVQSLLGVEQQSLFVHTAMPAFAQNQVRASCFVRSNPQST